MIFRRHAETLGAFSPASTAASFPPRPGGRVSTALFLANRTLQGKRDAAGCLTWRRWEAEVLVGVAGTEWPSHSTAGLLKPPPCARNTIPGPDDSRVFKVCLDGKGENKKPAPARRGKSKRPYWHTGGSLWSSFRSGRQQQDAICSAAPKGSGWIRRGRGHASWNNRLQSKSQRMPGTGCVDLKPTWPIYKFCFHWWQAELPDRGRFGELPGATICSVPPLPSGNERD